MAALAKDMSDPLRQPASTYPSEVQNLLKLSGRDVDIDTWLTGAESSIEFLQYNAQADRVVIYACLSHVVIHAVLARLSRLNNPDQGELGSGSLTADASWQIEHVSGGGKPDRVYLAPPLSNDSATLKGGEKLIFRRSWQGAKDASTEISQKFVHALDLHYVEERNAYCRLDEFGDIEEVIKVFRIPNKRFNISDIVITIGSQELHTYARLAGMGLVFFFDFTRYNPDAFSGWHNEGQFERCAPHICYHGGVQPGVGSYVNGRQIVLPLVTKRQIVQRYKDRLNPRNRSYAVFKAIDLKTGKRIEASCDPAKLSNYFEPDSELPLEMSPAYFHPEILLRYKSNPSKYELGDRNISCRGTWHLETYDVNEAGQVHTYLRYLGYLPYREQVYWQSFNEWPKGGLSKRAIQTDFRGEWDTEYEPLDEVKRIVGQLNDLVPVWWSPRVRDVVRVVHYPVSNAEAEWADAILALDQLVVEGFRDKALREIATEKGRTTDKNWRSLKLMEECLIAKGLAEGDAKAVVEPLRRVQHLRSIVKGHAAPLKKAEAAKEAVAAHGSLRSHFKALVADCDAALSQILDIMDADGD